MTSVSSGSWHLMMKRCRKLLVVFPLLISLNTQYRVPHFVSITSFRRRLSDLLKVKRGVYAGAPNEICDSFKGETIEQIRQNRDMILLNDELVVIKLRLPDKGQRLSKANGFRLIYLAMKHVPLVTLLDLYPKRGPSQQLDIKRSEIARLVEEFKTEVKEGSLVEHDINAGLKEI